MTLGVSESHLVAMVTVLLYCLWVTNLEWRNCWAGSV